MASMLPPARARSRVRASEWISNGGGRVEEGASDSKISVPLQYSSTVSTRSVGGSVLSCAARCMATARQNHSGVGFWP
eukprot:scaffold68028_cov27-Tisochrysis_lutea.AAC.2